MFSLAFMTRANDDAWRSLPPLDLLAETVDRQPPTVSSEPSRAVHFSMYVKGREAIFFVEGGSESVEVRFRYRTQAHAWQMFRLEGSRWVPDGPPGARAGRLLEKFVSVMRGADPRIVFAV
jgi:hypothetical protein